MQILAKKILTSTLLFGFLFSSPLPSFAQAEFNPHFILSDQELQDYNNWTQDDVQRFLDSKGSYLRSYQTADAAGMVKPAATIIYEAAQNYQINPKFLLVNLQKEQSLVTDDTPTQKQLDWAMGYAVCDSCSMDDPRIQKYKGFGKQVDNAAGIMRWYYNNEDKSAVKKKDSPIRIDNQDVIPQSWATAFLYTYTPHLNGNRNFSRIWTTWFAQAFPNGTLLKSEESGDMWLLQDGKRHHFKNQTALITRIDPKLALTTSDVQLSNYPVGSEIAFPNYSLLKTASTIYLLDYDTLRPFASAEVVGQLGYNPDELIEVTDADLAGYPLGSVITANSTAPQGVIYQITDLNNIYYLLKDGILYPIVDKRIITTNFKNLTIEKHKAKDLAQFETANVPVKFADGTLLQEKDSTIIYVIDQGKRRRIADDQTFKALGYKRTNVVAVDLNMLLGIPEGEKLFYNSALASSKSKFLGDSLAPVTDQFKTNVLPSYLVAEYPSGRIISGKAIDSRHSIASLTKLLTAYEALNEDFKLHQSTVYAKKKHATEDNKLGFKEGEKIKNNDLFNALLIGSINNSARMIAQGTAVGEKGLINAVNDRLAEWGADDTTINDVTGLDDNNKSTARDLLKIFVKVLEDTTIKNTLGETTYSFRSTAGKQTITHAVKNTNQIMFTSGRNYRILATKTGYTDAAGGVLVMLIESKITKKQFVIVTLGNSDYAHRFDEPNKIAKWIATGKVQLTQR